MDEAEKLNKKDRKRVEREQLLMQGISEPVTVGMMIQKLQSLGVQPGMTLIPHISMSSLGWVCGGAQAVLQAMMTTVGTEGNILMPCYTGYNSDPGHWKYPPAPAHWLEIIRREMPAYDKELSPPSGMGRVVECLRALHGTSRSNHPRSSFIAWGRDRDWLVSAEGYDFPFGPDGPLGKACRLDARILMIGVDYTVLNSFYLAYSVAHIESKPVEECRSVIMDKGHRRWVVYLDYARDINLFRDIFDAFVKEEEPDETAIGAASCHLIVQKNLVDFARESLERQGRAQKGQQ